ASWWVSLCSCGQSAAPILSEPPGPAAVSASRARAAGDVSWTYAHPPHRPLAMSRTFASLRYINYRLWFAGALVSNVGTWMQRVAQDWLVLTVLTADSGVAVGVVTALQFVPFLLIGPWAGLLADRMNQRRLLIAT